MQLVYSGRVQTYAGKRQTKVLICLSYAYLPSKDACLKYYILLILSFRLICSIDIFNSTSNLLQNNYLLSPVGYANPKMLCQNLSYIGYTLTVFRRREMLYIAKFLASFNYFSFTFLNYFVLYLDQVI